MNDPSAAFAYDSLESIRKRLLDLSNRNALLNYKFPRAKSLQFIETTPNAIFHSLNNKKIIDLLAIPMPSDAEIQEYIDVKNLKKPQIKHVGNAELASIDESTKLLAPNVEIWAKHLGYSTSFDLVELDESCSKDQDEVLQSLLYPKDLEARLKYIKQHAESAISETGSNILYVAIGFLQWKEDKNSDLKRLAPLFTIPVKIDKKNKPKHGGYDQFELSVLDDGLISNVTLQEKLNHDFGLTLPLLDENSTPEDYFKLIEDNILIHQSEWKIQYKVSLCLLNFTKQAMYQDLDASQWPGNATLEQHPILQKLFSKVAKVSDNQGFMVEHKIDQIDNIHEKFPIIYDADSSQHSALIDAVNGENLVIEGPPGSGKSQTITNLIAAAINDGKKVLFVAEKMAALNVVKDRLDQSGLGGFCLELHSHKSNKLKIVQGLSEQYQLLSQYRKAKNIEFIKTKLSTCQSELNDYVLRMNETWKNTNFTVHEILIKATYLKNALSINPEDVLIDQLDLDTINPSDIHGYIDQANLLESAFLQTQNQCPNQQLNQHAWYGIHRVQIVDSEKVEIISALNSWNQSLTQMLSQAQTVYAVKDINLELMEKIVADLDLLPASDPAIPYHFVPIFVDCAENLQHYIHLYAEIVLANKCIGDNFDCDNFAQLEQDQIQDLKNQTQQRCFDGSLTLADVTAAIEQLEQFREHLNELIPDIELIRKNVIPVLQSVFNISEQSFEEMVLLISHLKAISPELLRFRSELFDQEELDRFIIEFEPLFNDLKRTHLNSESLYKLDALPSLEVIELNYKNINIGGFFKYFTRRWWNAKKTINLFAKNESIGFSQLRDGLPRLIEYKKNLDSCKHLNQKHQIAGEFYNGVDTPFEEIKVVRGWYKSIRQEYGIGFDERVQIGSALLQLDSHLIKSIVEEYERKVEPKLQRLRGISNDFKHAFAYKILGTYNFYSINQQNSEISELLVRLKTLKRSFDSIVADQSISLTKIQQGIDVNIEKLEKLPEFEKLEAQYPVLSVQWGFDVSKSAIDDPVFETAQQTLELIKVIQTTSQLNYHKLKYISEIKGFEKFKADLKLLFHSHRNEMDKRSDFLNVAQADESWTSNLSKSLQRTIKRNDLALSHGDWLFTWSDYQSIRTKSKSLGLSRIIDHLERGELHKDKASDVVQLSIFSNLAKYILNTDELIQKYNGLELSSTVSNFQSYDRELLKLQRLQIAHNAAVVHVPAGISTGRVGDLTEYSLIAKEASKKTRHIPIRSLMERSSQAIQALKPCFMMSPMSVAQYLKPGLFDFDLMIMDEASQILPEDAIGALARAKNTIIVGDPKQLPPTSFFSTSINIDEDNEDEMMGIEESESILDSVSSLFKTRRLRWHYRSRHPSLIAFSNQKFYDSDLVLFPSPILSSEEFGIRYKKIIGAFNTGRNQIEAQSIVDEVCEQLRRDRQESIGIVAMNSQQRDEIEKQLELRLYQDELLQNLYDKKMKSHEPIFIKNLENVQGDERDVIIISMTYGPSEFGGKVYQRFGPINQVTGWRRLNVLFTRSKKRMHIFSSMSSTDILASSTSSKGVVALKDFLRYCENGSLHEERVTAKAPDSDFEIAVMQALEKYGYVCEPQLGVAGYFLDLAVKNPLQPAQYLLAVECDGATYHSAKSSRDRDRLRQQILEGLGWKIHRIWSTDWFKNSQEQIQILVNKLDELKRIAAEQKREGIEAFRLSQENIFSEKNTAQVTDPLLLQLDAHKHPTTVKKTDLDIVEVGDMVKYLDHRQPDKLLSVKISNNANNFEQGITQSNSPLGEALLGMTVDEQTFFSLPSGDVSITVRKIIKS